MKKLILSLVAIGLAGCATVDLPKTPKPPIGTIAAVEERGVEDNPEARLFLQMAKDGITDATKLNKDDDEEGANLALMRADADAELALAMVRRDGARLEVEKVRDQIQQLKSDMNKTR